MGCQRPVTQAASRDAARSQDLRWIVIRKGSSCRQRATFRTSMTGGEHCPRPAAERKDRQCHKGVARLHAAGSVRPPAMANIGGRRGDVPPREPPRPALGQSSAIGVIADKERHATPTVRAERDDQVQCRREPHGLKFAARRAARS